MARSILASSVAVCLCSGLMPLLAADPTLAAQPTHLLFGPATASANSNESLRAAAEPFEKLTEICFETTLLTIDQTIEEAQPPPSVFAPCSRAMRPVAWTRNSLP